jgi:hypothetical protein
MLDRVLADVSVYWLVLALALTTAESALIGLGWRNILRAAYPDSGALMPVPPCEAPRRS